MAVAELAPKKTVVRKSRSLYQEAFIRLFKNKAAVISIVFIAMLALSAIFAPLITTGDFARQDLLNTNAVPSWLMFLMPPGAENYANITNEFFLGTDDLGRDLWTRVIYGTRVSLLVALVASSVSLIIGVIYGLTAGYMGGKVDGFMMRIVDFLYGFPALILLILMQTYFKALARRGDQGGLGGLIVSINDSMGGLFFLFIALGLLSWLAMSRITRGQVLSLKQKEFVEAAKSVGASGNRVVTKHLLPNILGPILVWETLAIPGYILTEAFLSFIGLGVDPPTPSWGIMVSEAAPGIRSYPTQLLPAALALTLTVLAFNFIGDGLRDAFDPRMKE